MTLHPYPIAARRLAAGLQGPRIRQEPRGESGWATAPYFLLGLSTCLTIFEPAPFELIALPLMLMGVAQHALARRAPYPGRSADLVFMLALFCLLQVLPILMVAQDLVQSIRYAAVTALLVVIGVHLGRLFGEGDPRFRAFTTGYCIAAVLSAALAVGSLYVGEFRALPEWLFYAGRPKAFFKDPNVLGPYLVPAVLVFMLTATQVRGIARAAFLACALLCALGVVATASRGAWVNLAIAASVYMVLARGRGTFLVAGVATALIAGALVVVSGMLSTAAPDLLELFTSRTQLQDYDDDRFQKARQAWDLGRRHPLGVGPGEITHYTGIEAMAPHNTYARIWAENGPAAFLLFAWMLAMALVRALGSWRRAAGLRGSTLAVVLGLLLGVLVNAAIVDALHWRHFWVLLGLCVFSARSDPAGVPWVTVAQVPWPREPSR